MSRSNINDCNSILLRLVSQAHALISEIFRLHKHIPNINLDQRIYNFQNLSNHENFEKKLSEQKELFELEKITCQKYSNIISQFYSLFQAVYTYILDLNQFWEDLNSGIFLQINVDNILCDNDNKQLLCESLYLYGVMLLLIDLYIPGTIRECLLFAHYRFRTESDSVFDQICQFFRNTGFCNSSLKRPANYPEHYFSRIQIDNRFIKIIIDQLRTSDLYHQSTTIYPKPEHKSIALTSQASMLVTCLFFSPEFLHNQNAKMREIVDKFFSDNWVLALYMGITVNLFDIWEPYKAATQALLNISDNDNMQVIANDFQNKFQELQIEINNWTINENSLLPNINDLLNKCREANIIFRWILLHQSIEPIFYFNKAILKRTHKIESNFCEVILDYLLNLSDFEQSLKKHLTNSINNKEADWIQNRTEIVEILNNLSDLFQKDLKTIIKIDPNPKLSSWFREMSSKVAIFEIKDMKKLLKFINTLNKITDLHQIASIAHVKQLVENVKERLINMLYLSALNEDVLVIFQTITDFSYASNLINKHLTKVIQNRIKIEPNILLKLQSIFIKLASTIEIPLIRINNQLQNTEFQTISDYYSSELVTYIQTVLQIIPSKMFNLLWSIVQLKCNNKESTNQFEITKLTNEIATYSKGFFNMQKTFVGIICIDPKHLLDNGIRTEVSLKFAQFFHHNFTFQSNDFNLDFILTQTQEFENTIEYLQDYLKINVLQIYLEEISKVINYYIEHDCNIFLTNNYTNNNSNDIPLFCDTTTSLTFMGRLANELIRVVSNKHSIYLENIGIWTNIKTKTNFFNFDFGQKLASILKPIGLLGLDKIFSTQIHCKLQLFFDLINNEIINDNKFLDQQNNLKTAINDNNTLSVMKSVHNLIEICSQKYWPKTKHLILEIGTIQILRNRIVLHLNTISKLQSSRFSNLLQHVNDALIEKIRQGNEIEPNSISFIIPFLQKIGLYNPYNTVFLLTKNSEIIPYFLSLHCINEMKKMLFSSEFKTLISKKSCEFIDFFALTIGTLTIMRQLHPQLNQDFVKLLSQLILINTYQNFGNKTIDTENFNYLHFLEIYCSYSKIDRTKLESIIPTILLNNYHFMLNQKSD